MAFETQGSKSLFLRPPLITIVSPYYTTQITELPKNLIVMAEESLLVVDIIARLNYNLALIVQIF